MNNEYLVKIESLLRDKLAEGDADAVLHLGAILDAAENETDDPTTHLPSMACHYAAHGIPVFPCRARGKQPATSNGFKDATTDAEIIGAWWGTHPDANIATPTGIGFDVIDIDGPEGVETICEQLAVDGVPEPIAKVSTPRDGGMHFYVPPSGWGNKTKIYPGIDYRGDGGYVLLPPSITDEHGTGRRYTWLGTPLEQVR